MPTVLRDGVELFYTDEGHGPVVLLHTGGGGDHKMWSMAGYPAHLNGFRLIGLDHRGHGRSGRPTEPAAHRVEEYVADLVAVLDHAGVDRCAILGYSGGASVAYRTAAAHPTRVWGVVAIGNVPTAADAEADPAGPREWAAEVRRTGMRAAMQGLASTEAEPPPGWLLDNLATTPAEMFALLLEAWGGDSSWGDLDRIECPVLLVCGAEESQDPEPATAARQCRAGRAVVLPGYGHLQTFWHAETTGPLVAEFLAEVVP